LNEHSALAILEYFLPFTMSANFSAWRKNPQILCGELVLLILAVFHHEHILGLSN
jgi:hypothetical protein